MMRRRPIGPLLFGALLLVALPSAALASGRDGGVEPAARGKREGRAPRREEADAPEPPQESPLERRRRDQKRVALYIVGGALGVYVLYKIVRR